MEYKKQVLEAEKKHEENHAELQRLVIILFVRRAVYLSSLLR